MDTTNGTIENRIKRLSQEEHKLLFFKAKQLLAEKSVERKPNGSQNLVAYVTTKNGFDAEGLKRSLRTKIPEYMVPSKIVKVDKFPVLPNGKVDKKALSRLNGLKTYDDKKEVAAPTNEIQKKLIAIWEEVLHHEGIGIHDNFFAIGGDSILSIQVIAKARAAGMVLSANQLFEHQTVAELARFVQSKDVVNLIEKISKSWRHVVGIRTKGSKPPIFCLHSGGSHFFFYNLLANHLSSDRPVYAVQASKHEGEIKLHQSIQEMAADFIDEIREVQPNGPYHLVSYCYNTAIGLEITKILERDSEPVNLMIADTMADYMSLFAPSRTKTRTLALLERIKANPFKAVKGIIKSKVSDPFKEWKKALLSTGSQKVVQKLHRNHINIYGDYKWEPVEHGIQLLLTQKKDNQFNTKVISSWEKLTKTGVNVIPVEGHHDRLFLAPTVTQTATSIETCMQNFEKETVSEN